MSVKRGSEFGYLKPYKTRAGCVRALRSRGLDGFFCVSGWAGADSREFVPVDAGTVEDILADGVGRERARMFLEDRSTKRRYFIDSSDVKKIGYE